MLDSLRVPLVPEIAFGMLPAEGHGRCHWALSKEDQLTVYMAQKAILAAHDVDRGLSGGENSIYAAHSLCSGVCCLQVCIADARAVQP